MVLYFIRMDDMMNQSNNDGHTKSIRKVGKKCKHKQMRLVPVNFKVVDLERILQFLSRGPAQKLQNPWGMSKRNEIKKE